MTWLLIVISVALSVGLCFVHWCIYRNRLKKMNVRLEEDRQRNIEQLRDTEQQAAKPPSPPDPNLSRLIAAGVVAALAADTSRQPKRTNQDPERTTCRNARCRAKIPPGKPGRECATCRKGRREMWALPQPPQTVEDGAGEAAA